MEESILFKTDFVKSLIFELQCYKCRDLPSIVGLRKNRYSCVKKGHILCNDCKTECLCGSKVGKKSMFFASKFLEGLPDNFTTCPNSKFGCHEFIENLEDHIWSCSFRLANCPQNGCEKKFSYKDLIDHIDKSHKFSYFHEGINGPNGHFNLCLDFSNKKLTNGPMGLDRLKTKEDQTFFFTGCSVNNVLYSWIYYYGAYNENQNFKYCIKTVSKSIEELQYSALTVNLGQDAKTILNSLSVFSIGNELIQHLKNSEGKLKFQVTIEDLKNQNVETGIYDVSK